MPSPLLFYLVFSFSLSFFFSFSLSQSLSSSWIPPQPTIPSIWWSFIFYYIFIIFLVFLVNYVQVVIYFLTNSVHLTCPLMWTCYQLRQNFAFFYFYSYFFLRLEMG